MLVRCLSISVLVERQLLTTLYKERKTSKLYLMDFSRDCNSVFVHVIKLFTLYKGSFRLTVYIHQRIGSYIKTPVRHCLVSIYVIYIELPTFIKFYLPSQSHVLPVALGLVNVQIVSVHKSQTFTFIRFLLRETQFFRSCSNLQCSKETLFV